MRVYRKKAGKFICAFLLSTQTILLALCGNVNRQLYLKSTLKVRMVELTAIIELLLLGFENYLK